MVTELVILHREGGHFYRAVSQKLQRVISDDWYHGIHNNFNFHQRI